MKQLSRLIQRILIHRRLVASLCAGLSVLLLGQALATRTEPMTTVVVASGRIEAGTTLTSSQVRLESVPTTYVPPGALTSISDALGRMTATAQPPGAILGPDCLVQESATTLGYVIVPLTVAADLIPAIHPGSLVTVFVPNQAGEVQVTRGVRVVTVPQAGSGMFSSSSPTVVLVEIPESVATTIASGTGLGAVTVALG